MSAPPADHDAGAGGTAAPPPPDENNRAPDLTREYRNNEITVRWFAKRCIHSAECIRRAPRAFDPRRRPWIDLSETPAEQIRQAVDACPTGALEYVTERPAVPPENVITPIPGGPLYVRGDIRIVAEDGTLLRRGTRVALCRCGRSQNMPFCDNSHRAARRGS